MGASTHLADVIERDMRGGRFIRSRNVSKPPCANADRVGRLPSTLAANRLTLALSR